MKLPEWWPENPYPEDIFPTTSKEYADIIPDPTTRSAISGMLGREFWGNASRVIWEALLNAIDDGWLETEEVENASKRN